jgi:hypothetical protein
LIFDSKRLIDLILFSASPILYLYTFLVDSMHLRWHHLLRGIVKEVAQVSVGNAAPNCGEAGHVVEPADAGHLLFERSCLRASFVVFPHYPLLIKLEGVEFWLFVERLLDPLVFRVSFLLLLYETLVNHSVEAQVTYQLLQVAYR